MISTQTIFEPFTGLFKADEGAIACIDHDTAWAKLVLPIAIHDDLLHVAVIDDDPLKQSTDLSSLLHRQLHVWTLPRDRLKLYLEGAYPKTRSVATQFEPNKQVAVVQGLYHRAAKLNASDIHIEPTEDGRGAARYRVDGVMTRLEPFPPGLFREIIGRIKSMADIDSSRLTPHDGRMQIVLGAGRRVSCRVSTVPVGSKLNELEKVVIRLLGHFSTIPTLAQLGMTQIIREQYLATVQQDSGFVLTTGPTGSGKTTSLYATFGEIDLIENSAASIEDPIEHEIPGVAQTQVNPTAKTNALDFADVLPALMRQDPDYIMVGEIRDSRTAKTGFEAALTGHMILSTMHAPDALRAIDRLVDLGVSRTTVSSGLSLVLGQRLVRRLCPDCKRECPTPHVLLRRRPDIPGQCFTHSGKGPDGKDCPRCMGMGYRGRVGVFEALVVNDEIQKLITRGAAVVELQQAARATASYEPMAKDAERRVLAGDTSWAEAQRCVYLDQRSFEGVTSS